jgi:thiamine pyrophosphate-dependent acetolactate synthase large subunit-like protein
MSQTVGDFVVQRLHDWGVEHIFGYPGDGINGVFGALNRADGKIQFVQARHEEMAAFMASAYAKFSGRLGVCIATSGPGASHLVTGLYDALMDHQPVLAIVGQQARNALGGQYQQELDLVSMNNMAELITVAKYWREWKDPRWIVCVFNNEDLNQVTWEQRIINGDPKFEASQRIPNVSYSRFADLIGLYGIYVDRPDQVGSAWDQALASKIPVVLEVKTDPEVPPLPPHITLEQARNFSIALAKGDPDEVGVIRGTARQVLESVLPGKK